MTAKKDLKNLIKDRRAKTGESYMAARRHLLSARSTSAPSTEGPPQPPVDGNTATASGGDAAPREVRVEDLPHLYKSGHELLVPADAPECGPYKRVRRVPESKLEAALATGKWRTVTMYEVEQSYGGVEDFTEGWKHLD